MVSKKENMKKKSARVTSIGIVIAFVLCLLSSPTAIAGGIAVSPSCLELQDALRGGEFERTITVYNPGEETAAYRLSATGDAGGWISFYEQNAPSTPIDRVTIPSKGNAKVMVKFDIPADAPNRKHEATIVVTSIPVEEEGGGSGQVVSLSAVADVTIAVTGTQILSGKVSSISTRDVEVGYTQRTYVLFQNTGNVVATPQIDVEITKDGKFTDSLTFAEAEIGVKSLETITIEWDTTGNEPGDYLAKVTFSLGGKVLATKELPFKLLPIGTLSRQGSLTDLVYEGEPTVGRTIKILATFVNTGEIDTKAKFIGELYVDGDLIDTINSEELLVPVRETGTLTAYLKLENDGSYTIKGHALYEGKMTETKELSFDVRTESEPTELEKPTEPEKPTKEPLIPGFEAIGVIIAIASAMVCLRYRRRKSL